MGNIGALARGRGAPERGKRDLLQGRGDRQTVTVQRLRITARILLPKCPIN